MNACSLSGRLTPCVVVAKEPHPFYLHYALAPLSFGIIAMMITGCSMPDMSEPHEKPEVVPEVCDGRPTPTRQDWDYSTDSGGNEELDFTKYERDALNRLYAEGWNGDGVRIVIKDEFLRRRQARPRHRSLEHCASLCAEWEVFSYRNSQIIQRTRLKSSAFHLVNHSYGPLNPDGKDELPVAQSRALRDDSSYGSYAALEVWGAGNLDTPLADDNPASATPAMLANGFVAYYARGWQLACQERAVGGRCGRLRLDRR